MLFCTNSCQPGNAFAAPADRATAHHGSTPVPPYRRSVSPDTHITAELPLCIQIEHWGSQAAQRHRKGCLQGKDNRAGEGTCFRVEALAGGVFLADMRALSYGTWKMPVAHSPGGRQQTAFGWGRPTTSAIALSLSLTLCIHSTPIPATAVASGSPRTCRARV